MRFQNAMRSNSTIAYAIPYLLRVPKILNRYAGGTTSNPYHDISVEKYSSQQLQYAMLNNWCHRNIKTKKKSLLIICSSIYIGTSFTLDINWTVRKSTIPIRLFQFVRVPMQKYTVSYWRRRALLPSCILLATRQSCHTTAGTQDKNPNANWLILNTIYLADTASSTHPFSAFLLRLAFFFY